jgi:hypothetical protein
VSVERALKSAQTRVEQGQTDTEVARHLVDEYQLSPTELAVVLKRTVMSNSASPSTKNRKIVAKAMTSGSNNSVDDATYLASLLVASITGITPSDVTIALKDPRNYPNLTAYEMGEVLKAGEVFPNITSADMRTALLAAGYAAVDVDQAIAQLYTTPPTVSYRRLGPAGSQGQMPFDDNDLATAGNMLTQLIVRHGNIIDSLQAFYGIALTPSAVHGGGGGGPSPISIPSSDALVEVSGYTGYWFGASYVLQLTFRTQGGQVFGPYGDMAYSSGQTPFSFQVGSNEQIVGFFGSATYGDNGRMTLLGSLGVIVQSN